MIIKTEKFIIRELKTSDKEDYIKNINNPEVLKYMGGEYDIAYYSKFYEQ